jgi:hypothetical protein
MAYPAEPVVSKNHRLAKPPERVSKAEDIDRVLPTPATCISFD